MQAAYYSLCSIAVDLNQSRHQLLFKIFLHPCVNLVCYNFEISDDMLKYRCTLTSVVYFSSLFVASCPDPGVPQNGQRVGTSFGHGKHLQFYCSSGYWLVGSQLIVCNEGKWSNDIPTCKGRFSIVRTQRDIVVFWEEEI